MLKFDNNVEVIIVSGGFDPIHIGHIRLFNEAKALGNHLIVILNNDAWLTKKKKYNFMCQEDRKEIIESLRAVDEVIITEHSLDNDDMSVCRELENIYRQNKGYEIIFANGGDRFADNIPEARLCKKLGIKTVFNIGKGGKIRSSSELVENVKRTNNRGM